MQLIFWMVFGLDSLLNARFDIDEANPAAANENILQSMFGYRLLAWFCAAGQVLPVILGIVIYAGTTHTRPDRLGSILVLGISSGGIGIVVSHELINCIDNRFEPILSRIVLASVLYLH